MRLKLLVLMFLVGALPAFGAKKMKCGVERWPIKTMNDSEADQVEEDVEDITIAQLRSLKAPSDLHSIPDHRHEPVEFIQYRVHALLLGYKQENDEDFHLVLADPTDVSVTMIAEIPSVGCMSPEYASITDQEQTWIQARFGKIERVGKYKPLPVPVLVIVQGVGFFDFLHGQTGVAPNGIELHPVLKIDQAAAYRRKDDDEAVAKE